ncbi:MAG: substrate-binding periplasmic protein [Bacillota bacterium]
MKQLFKKIELWGLILGLIIIFSTPVFADNIEVNFKYKGQEHNIVGEKINSNTYVFNKSGDKSVKITTLNWEPYIGEKLPGQGWVQQVTIAILASQGYKVTSVFYPWPRGVSLVEKGQVDILYPAYYLDKSLPSKVVEGTKRRDHVALSNKIPEGDAPIAIMKRKGESIDFNGDVTALKDEKIGVVRGYYNTEKFNHLKEEGYFDVSEAVNDLMNAQKLYAKRVNLIIGDPLVVKYSVADSNLSPQRKEEILNTMTRVEPNLKDHNLYYAISKHRDKWKELQADINKAIKEFKKTGEIRRLIKKTNKRVLK